MSVPWRERGPARHNVFARLIVAIATGIYRIAAPIVRTIPGLLLIAAIVVSCLLAWAFFGLFHTVGDITASSSNTSAVSVLGMPLTVAEIYDYAQSMHWALPRLSAYVLWAAQSELLRDIIALIGILILFNVIPVYAIWWERKVAGRIQSRLGPMRAGRWHGWAQSFADGVKLIIKEDLVPGGADRPLFRIAAYLAFAPSFLAFLALPIGTYWVFRNIDVALLFVLAMLGIEVVGVIVGGWSSNNKWSVYGAMREACQMVSYEIPMTTVLLVPIMAAGTLNLSVIGDLQRGGWHTWYAFHSPFTFVAFVTYFICSLASCKRAPFDLPEAESELVAGFHTEYSGFRWAMFFFAEYCAMFVVSALAVTLFLGAWHSPIPGTWRFGGGTLWEEALNGLLFSGPFWFLLKCVFFLYVQIWLRWTLPRIRIDQVLYACVQVLFPIALITLVGHALWMLLFPAGSLVFTIVNVILSIIGAGFLLVAIGIGLYGFIHRRRLVGYLVVDPLRGA